MQTLEKDYECIYGYYFKYGEAFFIHISLVYIIIILNFLSDINPIIK